MLRKKIFFVILVFIIFACSHQRILSRSDYAPIKLGYVDFKISKGRNVNYWGDKIGNYNFRLFGCTRKNGSEIILNTGRVMQRNLRFFNNFFEGLNNYYSVIVSPDNPYFIYSDFYKSPEYLIIAEITGLFMNVCDHYDWRTHLYPNLRSGSSEIEVLWKVTDLTRRNLFWHGISKGYATIDDPIINGEARLVEKAFADAVERMRHLPGFNETIAQRRPQHQLTAEREILALFERQSIKSYDQPVESSTPAVDLTPKEVPIEEVTSELLKEPTQKAIDLKDEQDKWLDLTVDDLAQKEFKADDGWIGDANYQGLITIKKQTPFEQMTPYVMYRLRTGVVSVENNTKNLASGLLISPELILTTDNIVLKNPTLKITTINDYIYSAQTIRRNPFRNAALLTQEPTGFYPLPLRLDLPEIGEEVFFALGAPTYETGEGFLDDKGIVTGYRYLESGTEILTNTYVQAKTLGGALIDKFGNILGMAKDGIKLANDEQDTFIPIASALEKLGVEIEK